MLGGVKACELVLHARETEAEISLRISRTDVGLGEVIEPDMRLTSLTMMGSSRFTEDNAWMVCQMAKCEETSEEMAARTTERAFRIVRVVQHVPLPVSAALVDYLRVSGFHNLSIREPVARRKPAASSAATAARPRDRFPHSQQRKELPHGSRFDHRNTLDPRGRKARLGKGRGHGQDIGARQKHSPTRGQVLTLAREQPQEDRHHWQHAAAGGAVRGRLRPGRPS